MNKGIFYMLTATEISLIKNIVTDYMACDGADKLSAQDALEILNKLNPIDYEDYREIIEDLFNDDKQH